MKPTTAKLHAACSASFVAAENKKRLDVLRSLLDAGADPNARGKDGWTALHAAARSGTPEMVALLLEHGGDPNVAESKFGSYPVHFALDRKAPILRALLEGGARADVKDSLGFTPAMRTKRKDLRALLARKPTATKKPAARDLGPLFAEASRLKKKELSGAPISFLRKSSRTPFDECDLSPHAYPELHPIGDLSGRLLVVDGTKAPLPVLVFDEGEFTRLAPSWRAFVAKLR